MNWEKEYRQVYFAVSYVMDAIMDDDIDRAIVKLEDIKDSIEVNLLKTNIKIWEDRKENNINFKSEA